MEGRLEQIPVRELKVPPFNRSARKQTTKTNTRKGIESKYSVVPQILAVVTCIANTRKGIESASVIANR